MKGLEELGVYEGEEKPESRGVKDSVSDIVTLEFKTLQNRELFENLYDENTKSGNWKPRTQEEKENILQNYKILKSGQKVIAGLALRDYQLGEQRGKLIECLWGSPDYEGAGSQIIQKAFELISEGESLFAYSAQGGFFEKCGFIQVLGETSSTGNFLYQKKK